MSGIPGEISSSVDNVKNTFSSWDSCMSKAYCKWPAIAGIVIGSLILLSVLWCVASCLCCGATLCGSCLKCLTCCECCGACGRSDSGSGRTRHKDDYSQMPPTPYNGYQPQPSPMTYQPVSSTPQFAQFDASRKIHDDSLPAMPSWDTAQTRRVEDHSTPPNGFGNDVEMGRMSGALPTRRTRGGYKQVPQIGNGPVSPMSPPVDYGHFENQAHPYASDIGTQRLGHQQQTQQTGYSDFNPSPLSPAPTYRTYPSVAPGSTAGFNRVAISPVSEYHNNSYSATRDQAWSPLPSGRQEAPSYHSYSRSLSPPADQQVSNHNLYQTHESSSARPPSLLQIGRKPVSGSQREV